MWVALPTPELECWNRSARVEKRPPHTGGHERSAQMIKWNAKAPWLGELCRLPELSNSGNPFLSSSLGFPETLLPVGFASTFSTNVNVHLRTTCSFSEPLRQASHQCH